MRPVTTIFGTLFLASLTAAFLLNPGDAQAKSGKEIFTTVCVACHTVGQGAQAWRPIFINTPLGTRK